MNPVQNLWHFMVKSDNVYIANNKQMPEVKLLANSTNVKLFWTCQKFTHFSFPIPFLGIIDHSWMLLTMFQQVMLNSNEPIKVSDLQCWMVHNSFSESKKNFEILVVKNISPLSFSEHLSYSEVLKNRKVVNIWNRFQQFGSLI